MFLNTLNIALICLGAITLSKSEKSNLSPGLDLYIAYSPVVNVFLFPLLITYIFEFDFTNVSSKSNTLNFFSKIKLFNLIIKLLCYVLYFVIILTPSNFYRISFVLFNSLFNFFYKVYSVFFVKIKQK